MIEEKNRNDEDFSYDANGNLLTLKRNDEQAVLKNDFLYDYYAGTNKLKNVKATQTQNYHYDAIGNLTEDREEGTVVSWTPYGKVREVHKGDTVTVSYRYDASGNRVEKKVVKANKTFATRYLRDASGNVMAIYKDSVLSELPLYGSSRLGNYEGTIKEGRRTLGKRKFELSNHLGNVLSVVTDNVNMSGANVWATVASATDYTAFGTEMKGRTFSDSTYRYGFNGKEKDNFNSTVYDYGFRIYNPEIAKFLSVDPLTKEYPWNSTYAFAENDVIRSIDLEGAERYVRTYSYSISNGKTSLKVTDDVWKQKTDLSIHPTGAPQTFKQIAAHSAITYQRNPKPNNGSFAYFEFAPELGKTNYAKYTYLDGKGQQQVQYFSQADMQFRFDEIVAAQRKLDATFNVAAAAANLIAAGWLVKAEVKSLSGELKGLTDITPLNQLKISVSEIDNIKTHLSRMDTDVANSVMINRLEKIAAGELEATKQDLNFYAHELRENSLMSKGLSYEQAHKQALNDYGIEYKRGYENQLYTKEALQAGDEALKKNK